MNVENVELTTARKQQYQLLAEIYKTEITDDMYDTIKNIDFNSVKDTYMERGYHLIKNFIDSQQNEPVLELAVDYARVFLGAGVVQKEKISAPYESVYTSQERLIMQAARDEVLAIYRQNGLDKKTTEHIPEDHLAIELEFMAYLCEKTIEAYNNSDIEAVERYVEIQKSFIDNHLLNWLPFFCGEVTEFARTDFYRGIADITLSFVNMDKELLNELH